MRPRFYNGITKMRRDSKHADPTRTHRFILGLRNTGKLVRHYTQNIDCLEEKVGLSTDLHKGAGNRSRFKKYRSRHIRDYHRVHYEPQPQDRGVDCVLLHGSLRDLRCPKCLGTCGWDECGREAETLAGQEPPCPRCIDISDARTVKGLRATSIGALRPDIVLYDEQDPWADMVSAIVRRDVLLRPDVLLIMGTSLRTHGVKRLVKDFAKVIHKRAGKVVFVNLTEPAESWDGVIDYWVDWDCDAWVRDLIDRRPELCSPTDLIDLTGEGEHMKVMASCGYDRRQGSSQDNPIDLTLS